ncbi:MAG: DsbA family protein [Alphaproteobacteria bacterium]|nr:DsbA family protein [Alphaproteobacteria bacterium]
MCSWCWGFAPQIDRVVERFGDRLPIIPVMGGLRPGTTETMSNELKAKLRGIWTQIHERTGQPFDFSFFERDGFVYDTEPACRAVVAVRETKPELALKVMRAIQQAFYEEGRDTTDADVLADLAKAAGMERALFLPAFNSAEMIAKTAGDFRLGPSIGVTGFPTLMAEESDGTSLLVTAGFAQLEEQLPALEAWLGGG